MSNLMPPALLAGFAVECALKSYLVGRFVKARDLHRKPYGHNLTKLWRDAARNGLPIGKLPPGLNQLTNRPKFFVRYHTGVDGLS